MSTIMEGIRGRVHGCARKKIVHILPLYRYLIGRELYFSKEICALSVYHVINLWNNGKVFNDVQQA